MSEIREDIEAALHAAIWSAVKKAMPHSDVLTPYGWANLGGEVALAVMSDYRCPDCGEKWNNDHSCAPIDEPDDEGADSETTDRA